jgi:predicted enzyme related to lactoylglutathione lyase
MSTDPSGRFVWHELLTNDTAAAAAFYPKVLPWRTQASSMPGYTIWMSGQSQVGGLMEMPAAAAGTSSHWLIYIGTSSVDNTCTRAQGLGARVHKPPADIPNVGRFAVLTDPQGATFAVFTPAAGAPAPQQPAVGGFTWHELATTDVAGALRFYGELFGWTKGPGHDMGGTMGVYQLIEHGGSQVGGMYRAQGPATPPSWLSYTQVADVNRAVAAAKSSGGRLLHGPMEVPGGSWIALMTDPQGGAFAAQEMPRTMKAPAAAPAKSAAAVKVAVKKAVAKKAVKKAVKKGVKKKMARKKVAKKRAVRKVRRAKRRVRRLVRRTKRPVRRAARVVKRRVRRGVRRAARRARRRR